MTRVKNKKKDKNNEKLKNATFVALKTLGLVGAVASVMVFPGLAYVFDALDKEFNDTKRGRRAFYNLKSQKLIKTKKKKNGKIQIILTDRGKKRVRDFALSQIKLEIPATWDGRWRMIMFDIPEFNRKGRDLIRHQLYKLGFIRIQKSVYIYPYPCQDLIEYLRKYFRLSEGQLYIFETKIIEGESLLREHFKV
jgi:hypothetical protein